jgi:hypothetical protein
MMPEAETTMAPARLRIDRTISIALIVGLIAETAAGLVWAGSAVQRLDAMELRAAGLDQIDARLARLEERVDDARASLIRIESRVNDTGRRQP